MTLSEILTPACIKIDLESTEKDELFEELLEVLIASQPQIDRAAALQALELREEKMSTGIIPGVAVPHAMCQSVKGVVAAAVGISRNGVEYDSLDGRPVHFILMMLMAQGETEHHLQILKDAALVLQKQDFLKTVLACKTAQEVYQTICTYEQADE